MAAMRPGRMRRSFPPLAPLRTPRMSPKQQRKVSLELQRMWKSLKAKPKRPKRNPKPRDEQLSRRQLPLPPVVRFLRKAKRLGLPRRSSMNRSGRKSGRAGVLALRIVSWMTSRWVHKQMSPRGRRTMKVLSSRARRSISTWNGSSGFGSGDMPATERRWSRPNSCR